MYANSIECVSGTICANWLSRNFVILLNYCRKAIVKLQLEKIEIRVLTTVSYLKTKHQAEHILTSLFYKLTLFFLLASCAL